MFVTMDLNDFGPEPVADLGEGPGGPGPLPYWQKYLRAEGPRICLTLPNFKARIRRGWGPLRTYVLAKS